MQIQRIAILSVHTSPLAPLGGKKTGGMNVYVRELSRELARRGILVDIYTRRSCADVNEVDRSLDGGVRVIHVLAGPAQPLEPEEIYAHLSQFTAGIIAHTTKERIKYDLVYSHYWLSGWVANKLKEVWHTPFVHMFHTLGHMKKRINAAPGHPMLPDLRIAVETQIVEWADQIIAATPAEQAQLLWLYRANRHKIAIAPPGMDAERFFPIGQREAKAKLHFPEDSNLLLFVGRIEPLKAVDTILEAISIIRAETPVLAESMYFAIIGGDPDNPNDSELARLRRLSQKLDLDRVVSFLGAKDHALLPFYYAAATAVIVPSDYESFGMVALEAMATGTPVIASEVGGLAFLVRDHETGLLVPVRDPGALAAAITDLLSNPQKRKLLGENAAHVARRYAWSCIADQLMPIFEALAARQPAAALSRRMH